MSGEVIRQRAILLAIERPFAYKMLHYIRSRKMCGTREKGLRNKKVGKVRYRACGLVFPKAYVYDRGGRPVVYDKTSVAKKYLPPTEHWRIVNLNLSNPEAIVDWTHEREWRVPDKLEFEHEDVAVIMPNSGATKKFSRAYEIKFGEKPLEVFKGVVNVSTGFF